MILGVPINSFKADLEEIQSLDLEGIIKAKAIIDQQKQKLIIQAQATDEFGTTKMAPLDSVEIESVKRANLRRTGFISEPQGAVDGTLSANQSFTIVARIENLAKARVEV